jgi:hypothetical protein
VQKHKRNKTNSVAWIRERTIPTELPPLVGEVSANFLRIEGCRVVSADLLEEWKLAQHSCEEGHSVIWGVARILGIGSNSRYEKYKHILTSSVCKILVFSTVTRPRYTSPQSTCFEEHFRFVVSSLLCHRFPTDLVLFSAAELGGEYKLESPRVCNFLFKKWNAGPA